MTQKVIVYVFTDKKRDNENSPTSKQLEIILLQIGGEMMVKVGFIHQNDIDNLL